MLCKGDCGKEAVYGNWCCESYYKCPGHRKKLSDKAKLRGNNGVRGTLSKKYTSNEKKIFTLMCIECKKEYQKELREITFLSGRYKHICKKCKYQDIGKKIKQSYKDKLKNINYDDANIPTKKRIIYLERGNKCECCGFKYSNSDGKGPYEIHHIDGDNSNWEKDNLKILCLNCHWTTPNYRFRNRTHTNESIEKMLKKNLKNGSTKEIHDKRFKHLKEK